MIKLYDRIQILSSGAIGYVIEIDDDNGFAAPKYLVEIEDTSTRSDISDVLIWCDWKEIKLL